MTEGEPQIRPLVRVAPGHWRSRDGRWTFMRHWSDPAPQRWFVFLDDDDQAHNEGGGETTLGEVVALVEQDGERMIEEFYG